MLYHHGTHLNLVAPRRIGIAKSFTMVPFVWSYLPPFRTSMVWVSYMWRQKNLNGVTHLSYHGLESNMITFGCPDTIDVFQDT